MPDSEQSAPLFPETAKHTNVNAVSDNRFAGQLQTIKDLKHFLFEEMILLKPEQVASIDLGALNNLKYDLRGRLPTEDEWRALDRSLSGITSLLTEELRWKLIIRDLGLFIKTLPIIFIVLAVITTFYYIMYPHFVSTSADLASSASYYGTELLWTITQGGLGACAFIGVSITTRTKAQKLAPTSPLVSIDIANRTTLTIRIIFGAMFALLIGLPLSTQVLQTLQSSMVPSVHASHSALPDTGIGLSEAPDTNVANYVLLLAPFMFGFSTNLVLSLLNRIVSGLSAFLGISSDAH